MSMITENMLSQILEREDGLDKLKELREMEKEYNAEQAMKSYRKAMSQLQGAAPVIKKLKVNEHNHSTFASLDDVVLQMQPMLEKFGFSFEWKQSVLESGNIAVKCLAHHCDGHSESCTLDAPSDMSGARGGANKTAVQGTASTVTYLRRYTYTGVFGIATADHDIDGRIEGVTQRQLTKSDTINQLLTTQAKHFVGQDTNTQAGLTVEEMLFSAQSLKELEAAATMIESVANPEDKEHLTEIYHQEREGHVNG